MINTEIRRLRGKWVPPKMLVGFIQRLQEKSQRPTEEEVPCLQSAS